VVPYDFILGLEILLILLGLTIPDLRRKAGVNPIIKLSFEKVQIVINIMDGKLP
jgi:hypothetical protein